MPKLETISQEYVDQNRLLHAQNPSYGANGHKWADRAYLLTRGLKGKSVLDYGCGKGGLVKAMAAAHPDWAFQEYDPAVEGKNKEPRPADVVVCTDVLEHIEPEKVAAVLSHIASLAKVGAMFVVDTRPAKKTYPNGQNAHLTVKPAQWWFDHISLFFDVRRAEIVENHGILFELTARQHQRQRLGARSTVPLIPFQDLKGVDVFMPGGAGHTIMPAFANGIHQGLRGVLEAEAPDREKAAVCWGLLRGTPYLYHRQRKQGGHFVYLDHGYARRGHFHGYYRGVWDAFQLNEVLDVPPDRWDALNIEMGPWNPDPHGCVLVCPPSPTVTEVFGLETWTKDTVARLEKLTDKAIAVREKADAAKVPLAEVLPRVFCVVTYNSIAAVEAIMHGIPALVDPSSAAAPVAGTDLTQIRDLPMPDRTRWAHSLAYGQWTLKEMQNGTAMKMLLEQPLIPRLNAG